jgi:hypothetical protein
MVRNRVRPIWLQVNDNDDDNVQEVTAEAFKVCEEGDWEEALRIIDADLYGVGPATASMILCLRYPSIPPYSEEALRVAGIFPIKYTLFAVETFVKIMSQKAEAIGCTPRDLEKAIWAATYESSFGVDPNDAPAPKSKKRRT